MITKPKFNASEFYSITMASIYQKIEQGDFKSCNEIDDYLMDEANFYVKECPDQVLVEVLPDDLTQLYDEFGEITSKYSLVFCSLYLWMEQNDMVRDGKNYFYNNQKNY